MTPEPACFEWLRLQTTWIRNILFWIPIQPTTSLILIKKLLDPDPQIMNADPQPWSKVEKRTKFHLYVHSFRH